MHLTPREQERLMLSYAGELARRRRERGVALNYPEAVALISSQIMEWAREGKSVAECMNLGRELIKGEEVMQGVAEMIAEVQVEATFPDGTKLVTVHEPIVRGDGEMIPGERWLKQEEIEVNSGRSTINLNVANKADRPIQVGSHCHFYEANAALDYDREAARGMRLNIPAGTAVRFEPGIERTVELVSLDGKREVFGLNGKIQGPLDD